MGVKKAETKANTDEPSKEGKTEPINPTKPNNHKRKARNFAMMTPTIPAIPMNQHTHYAQTRNPMWESNLFATLVGSITLTIDLVVFAPFVGAVMILGWILFGNKRNYSVIHDLWGSRLPKSITEKFTYRDPYFTPIFLEVGRKPSSPGAFLFPRGGREGLSSWRAYEIYPSQHCIYRLDKVTFEVDWEGMRIEFTEIDFRYRISGIAFTVRYFRKWGIPSSLVCEFQAATAPIAALEVA
ncbi:hypothetical protein E3N88_45626 [Mikania micrantha]|uniref:Uncharacterized protein n=1 Tax=Mikania micrantha TaxID=192012 RepID=A0A5N6L8N5_9ASTR|nr:hypothetical protein E3N88_45626 [Mikania micrantha]